MLLIERHVSAYSEAIIRFNNSQLYETNIFHGTALMMASEQAETCRSINNITTDSKLLCFNFLTLYLCATHITRMPQLKITDSSSVRSTHCRRHFQRRTKNVENLGKISFAPTRKLQFSQHQFPRNAWLSFGRISQNSRFFTEFKRKLATRFSRSLAQAHLIRTYGLLFLLSTELLKTNVLYTEQDSTSCTYQ